MLIENLDGLAGIRKKNQDKKIVFCSGNFDLTHAGHVIFFERCKSYGDALVVGVAGDEINKANKGQERPILNEQMRLKVVDSLKPVDYTLIDIYSTKESPLALLNEVFPRLNPDVYVINEGAFNTPYRKALCDQYGIDLEILAMPKDFPGLSTTSIINKIRGN